MWGVYSLLWDTVFIIEVISSFGNEITFLFPNIYALKELQEVK